MAKTGVSGLARLIGIVVVTIAVTLVYQYRNAAPPRSAPRAAQAEAGGANYFSPGENLERLDLEQLQRAQHRIDIAMYAFTDRYLAEQLVEIARRGVVIRIYRDREQYDQEQRRAGQRDQEAAMELFRGQANIHVRVKHSRELMHLKAYTVDGGLLRDGSANWSPTGLKRQDNNAHLTTDPATVRRFQQAFDEMWARGDNEEIQ